MDRTILHVDQNAFYASVECIRNPKLRNVPMAVCGSTELRHGIVLAKNELAKGFGIKTGMVNWEAKRLCPDLICVPPHMEDYIAYSRRAREIYARYTDQIEPFGIDECWLDLTGSLHLFGPGEEIANRIRHEMKEELGLTVSVGVSFNKVFAKLGSDYKKPDATTIFTRSNYPALVWPLPVEDLLFVGRATAKKLHGLGVHTIGQLACTPRKVLESIFGKNGGMLWIYANGLDLAPVLRQGESLPMESFGQSTTTPRDLLDNADVWQEISSLSDAVATRLIGAGLRGQLVEIWVRDSTLFSFVRQHKIAQPTCLASVIAKEAYTLFLKSYSWENPVRSIGVRLGCFSSLYAPQQMDLFDGDKTALQESLAISVHKMRERYGYHSILTGTEMRDKTLPVISPEQSRTLGAGMVEMTRQR